MSCYWKFNCSMSTVSYHGPFPFNIFAMVYVARFLLFVDNLETFKCTSVISAMLLNFKSELDPNVFKYFESENMR